MCNYCFKSTHLVFSEFQRSLINNFDKCEIFTQFYINTHYLW